MQDQVEEVKTKIDIVNIISEYVDLKKAGTNFKGLCPFHNEKTPSFMVNPELQFFKCFGCGEAGDVFSFLEKYEGMEFQESLAFLAEKAGVVLRKTRIPQSDNKEKLYEINMLVHRFYQYMLMKHPAGKKALDYLVHKRGLHMDTITTFELGFAPNDFSVLENVFIKKQKATAKELEALGLVYLRNGRATDRFRGRVMFPLFNHRGNLCGFAGRILPELDSGETGKYINSPETVLHHKSTLLFGLWYTRKEIKQKKYAVLVEGPMDALASFQGGITNVSAIQGTSLTAEQVKLLSRYTKKIVFCLDSDFAGDAAERRGIQIAEREGLEVRVARLTKYKDPGEAAISDPEGYTSAIKNAIGVWDFIIDSVFRTYNTNDGEEKAKISRELIPLLSTIEDTIIRAHYTGEVARRLNVPIDAVSYEINKKAQTPAIRARKPETTIVPKEKKRQEVLEERLLSIAFNHNPEYLILNDDLETMFTTPSYKRIFEAFLEYAKEDSKLDIRLFSQKIPKEFQKVFSDLILRDWEDLDKNKDNEYTSELDRLKRQLELLIIRSQLDKQAREIKSLKGPERRKKLLQVQKNFQHLQKLTSQLK